MYQCELHPDQLRKMGAGIRLAADAGMLRLYTDERDGNRDNLQQLRD